MKVIVGSLQYSPVYKSHCCALGRQLQSSGYSVTYLFSYKYEWMLSEEIKNNSFFIGKSESILSTISDGLNPGIKNKLESIFSREKPEYIYMYNFHPILNYHTAKLAAKYGVKFIQHVQEPYVENKKPYGYLKRYLLYVFEYFQERLLRKTDVVVLSSNEASTLFEKRYRSFSGRKVVVPLMYEDFGSSMDNTLDRKYITFIGPPVPAKGPEVFLEIAEYSEKHNLGLELLIISRTEITDPAYYSKSNITVFHQYRISDEEIKGFFSQSIMAITPYKTARQSSVVLTAYMYGTPVISTNVGGLPEVISHLKTGYLLNTNSPVESWIGGIKFITENFTEMSRYCRSSFMANFSEVNWPKYFKDVFHGNG